MSTDKTSLPHIPLVIGLLALCLACVPQHTQNLAAGQMPPPKPKQIELIVPEPAEPAADEAVEEEVAAEPEEETTITDAEQTVTEEVKELANLDNDWQEGHAADEKEILNDFPITVNLQVEYYLDFFQNSQHHTFARWLAQAGRYLPMIREKLSDAGLPQDLAYLPMIESGYNLTACSSSGAAGPWQFMAGTAHNLGLKVDEDIDERRDPFKSTDAAIKYLEALYNEFGSWYLAVAAYNAGEGRVRQAISNKGSDNFWKLAQGSTLNIETKRYVPKLIAAIMIARNPDKYGFDEVIPEPPLAYDEIKTPPRTALKAVAVAGNIPIEQLRDLNRQLLRGTTPANQKGYIIRVPVGKSDLVAQNFSRVRATPTTEFRTHVVSGRETLAKIARRYNLTKTILRKANNLHGNSVKNGQRLQIPCQTMAYSLASEHEPAGQQKVAALNTDNLVLHRIKKGENLSQIADRYNVTPQQIADWNDLKSVNDIRAGQKLAIYLDDARRNAKQSRTEPQQHTYYQVQGGDSLWTIAKKFNLPVEEIRRLNKLEDDIIKPGVRLIIKESDLGA